MYIYTFIYMYVCMYIYIYIYIIYEDINPLALPVLLYDFLGVPRFKVWTALFCAISQDGLCSWYP